MYFPARVSKLAEVDGTISERLTPTPTPNSIMKGSEIYVLKRISEECEDVKGMHC